MVGSRAQDGDALKGIELERVAVARDHEIGPAIAGDLEELVVAGIATGTHHAHDRYHLRNSPEQANEIRPIRNRQVRIELGPSDDVDQLFQRRRRGQQRRLLDGSPDRPAGDRAGSSSRPISTFVSTTIRAPGVIGEQFGEMLILVRTGTHADLFE